MKKFILNAILIPIMLPLGLAADTEESPVPVAETVLPISASGEFLEDSHAPAPEWLPNLTFASPTFEPCNGQDENDCSGGGQGDDSDACTASSFYYQCYAPLTNGWWYARRCALSTEQCCADLVRIAPEVGCV